MKLVLKRLLAFVLIFNFIFSSVMLSGCFMEEGNGGSGSGGGSVGDLENPDAGGEQPQPPANFVNYAKGIKVAYANSEENEELQKLVAKELKYIAIEILLDLSSEYGNGLELSGSGITLESPAVVVDDEDIIGQVFMEHKTSDIEPYLKTFFETLVVGDFGDVVPPEETELAKYTNAGAIHGNNIQANGVYTNAWNWSDASLSSGLEVNEYALNFAVNSLNYLKLAIGLADIVIGADFTDSTQMADYENQISNVSFSSLNDELLEVCANIQRTGIEESEFEQVSVFILNQVIGEENASYDATNFSIYDTSLGSFTDATESTIFINEVFFNLPNNDPNENYYYKEFLETPPSELYHDLNRDGSFNRESNKDLAVRKDYYKNYKATVNYVIEDTLKRLDANGDLAYKIGYLVHMRDMTSADVAWTEREDNDMVEPMTLPTQYQNYKNLIVMFSRNTVLNSIWLSIDANEGFDLTVYVRYYNADKGCYMSWLQPGNEFANNAGYTTSYRTTTLTIVPGEYSSADWFGTIGADLEINFKKLLTDAVEENDDDEEDTGIPSEAVQLNPNFNDVRNTSTVIPTFTNNFESYDESTSFMSFDNDFYGYANSRDGLLLTYNDNTTSYVEFLFTSSVEKPFRIGFMNIEPLK